MHRGREGQEFLPDHFRFEPRPARFVQQSEIVRHDENEKLKMKNSKWPSSVPAGADFEF
jgi:hypothetical protein